MLINLHLPVIERGLPAMLLSFGVPFPFLLYASGFISSGVAALKAKPSSGRQICRRSTLT